MLPFFGSVAGISGSGTTFGWLQDSQVQNGSGGVADTRAAYQYGVTYLTI